ncbi:MAG: hypothetical protein ABEI75_03290, partial [Halobaculum sp.]
MTTGVASSADASPTGSTSGVGTTDAGVRDRQESNTTNGTAAPNVSRVLAFPPRANRKSAVRAVRIDAGAITGLDAEVAGWRMETIATVNRIENAPPSERAAVVREEVDRVEAAADRLRRQQRQALTAFVNGSLTSREVTVRLLRIHALAGALQSRATRLGSIAESSAAVNESVATDAETVALNLRALRGPVRSRALAAARGDRAPTRVFVATTELGVVLSTIDRGVFIREAYLGRLWGEPGALQSAAASSDVVADSYPEIWAARNATEIDAVGFGSTFRLVVPHAGGELDAFVRRNEDVARAVQRVPLSAFPPGPSVRETVNGVRVIVNRTYPGGPMRITVRDAETGEPLDAQVTISVDGTTGSVVGRTGSDGQLWTLSPGVQFTVTADAGAQRISQLT